MKIMWINIANYINLQLLMLQRYQLKIYKMNLMALIIREIFFLNRTLSSSRFQISDSELRHNLIFLGF